MLQVSDLINMERVRKKDLCTILRWMVCGILGDTMTPYGSDEVDKLSANDVQECQKTALPAQLSEVIESTPDKARPFEATSTRTPLGEKSSNIPSPAKPGKRLEKKKGSTGQAHPRKRKKATTAVMAKNTTRKRQQLGESSLNVVTRSMRQGKQ